MLELHRYDLKTGIEKKKIFSDDIDDEDTKRTISNLNKYLDAYYYGVRVLAIQKTLEKGAVQSTFAPDVAGAGRTDKPKRFPPDSKKNTGLSKYQEDEI